MTKHEVEVRKEGNSSVDREALDERPVYRPATDIRAKEDGFVLTVDLPGVAADGLSVDLEENVLTIRGETQAMAREGYDVLHCEFEPCVFERSFTLSAEIDRERIDAQLKHGVLQLVLPKSAASQPRRIAVTSEA